MHTWFLSLTAAVGERFFPLMARSRKINLTVPSGSASWPIAAIRLQVLQSKGEKDPSAISMCGTFCQLPLE